MKFRRYRFNDAGVFNMLGPYWGPALNLYINLMRPADRREFTRILFDLNINLIRSDKRLRSFFKELESLAKEYFDVFTPLWRFFVGLTKMAGYMRNKDQEEFNENVRDWLITNRKHKIDGDEDKFYRYFNWGLDRFWSNLKGSNASEVLSMKDLFSRPESWGTSGISKSARFDVKVDKMLQKNVRISKLGAALKLDPSLIEIKTRRPKQARIRVFGKIEAAKVRPVASVEEDNINFLWAHIWQYLGPKFRQSPITTVGLNKSETLTQWDLAVTRCQDSRLYKFALDQTEFDHHITPLQHVMFLNSVKRYLTRTYGYVESIDTAIEKIKFAVKNAILKTDEGTFSNVQGFWSGLPYTIIGDTAMNAAEFFTVNRVYVERYGYDYLADARFQGDDVESWFHKDVKADFIEIYEELGFKISKSKSSISTKYDEFLRFSVDGDGMIGYPASLIKSVMWSRANEVPMERAVGGIVNEIASLWHGLMIRGLDYEKCLWHASNDLARAMKISRELAKEYLLTSTAYGGGGLADGSSVLLETTNTTEAKDTIQGIEDFYVYKVLRGDATTKRRVLDPYLIKLTDRAKYQSSNKTIVSQGDGYPVSYVSLEHILKVPQVLNVKSSWIRKPPPFRGSQILGSLQLEVLVLEKRYDEIYLLYENQELVRQARNWFRRSTWIDWLKGKLWAGSFRDVRSGPLLSSQLTDLCSEELLKRLKNYKSINVDRVRHINARIAATARRVSFHLTPILRV